MWSIVRCPLSECCKPGELYINFKGMFGIIPATFYYQIPCDISSISSNRQLIRRFPGGTDRDAEAPAQPTRQPTNQQPPICTAPANFFLSQARALDRCSLRPPPQKTGSQNFRQSSHPAKARVCASQSKSGEKTSNPRQPQTLRSSTRLDSDSTMAPLATASRLCLRSAAASSAKPAVRALSSSALRQADAPGAASYSSPFKGESQGSKIPDFSKYLSKGNETTNKLFSYFMVGTMGAITAAGAKSTVQGGLMTEET